MGGFPRKRSSLKNWTYMSSFVLADRAPSHHPISQSMSWSVLTAAKLVLSLLELALALPQFSPFRVHSSSLWCFFSLILGVNYMDIKLFIEKYSFNQLIEVLEDTSIYGARIHPPNAKLHLDINHLQTILKNTEARGNSMMSVIIFFFFLLFWLMRHWNVFPVLFLQIRTVPLFGSVTCLLKGRVWTQSRIWWKKKKCFSLSHWSSHLSPSDGTALGKPHDLLLVLSL